MNKLYIRRQCVKACWQWGSDFYFKCFSLSVVATLFLSQHATKIRFTWGSCNSVKAWWQWRSDFHFRFPAVAPNTHHGRHFFGWWQQRIESRNHWEILKTEVTKTARAWSIPHWGSVLLMKAVQQWKGNLITNTHLTLTGRGCHFFGWWQQRIKSQNHQEIRRSWRKLYGCWLGQKG